MCCAGTHGAPYSLLYSVFSAEPYLPRTRPICADFRHFALLFPLLWPLCAHFRSFVCVCVCVSIINVMRCTPQRSSSYYFPRLLLCFLLVLVGAATIPLYVLFLPSSLCVFDSLCQELQQACHLPAAFPAPYSAKYE